MAKYLSKEQLSYLLPKLNEKWGGQSIVITKTSGSFDDCVNPGIYTMKGISTKAPSSGSYHSLLVMKSDTGNYIHQIAIKEATTEVYIRFCSGSSWSSWKKIMKSGDNATSASVATKLATARKINGIPFDGTSDITEYCFVGATNNSKGYFKFAEVALPNTEDETLAFLISNTYSSGGIGIFVCSFRGEVSSVNSMIFGWLTRTGHKKESVIGVRSGNTVSLYIYQNRTTYDFTAIKVLWNSRRTSKATGLTLISSSSPSSVTATWTSHDLINGLSNDVDMNGFRFKLNNTMTLYSSNQKINSNVYNEFRTQTMGENSVGPYVSVVRPGQNDVPSMRGNSPALCFGVGDVHGFLALSYFDSDNPLTVGAGGGNKINYRKTVAMMDSTVAGAKSFVTCKFNANINESKWCVFARLYKAGLINGAPCCCTVIISGLGRYERGYRDMTTYLVTCNTMTQHTMDVVGLGGKKLEETGCDNIDFGYYVDGNYVYFGFHIPAGQYSHATTVSMLNKYWNGSYVPEVSRFYESSDAPTANWISVEKKKVVTEIL